MRHDRKKGFTLIELLVVVGIIIMATAMALPAINQFLKGQKLTQAGRLVQSAFNEARRAAITQRSRHWIFMGVIRGGGTTPDIYALAHYREGQGWDTKQVVKLPSSIQPCYGTALGTATEDAPMNVGTFGCGFYVQDWTDGLPPNTTQTANLGADPTRFKQYQFVTDPVGLVIIPASGPLSNQTPTWEFRKDGTLIARAPCVDVPPMPAPGGNSDVYDANAVFDSLNLGSVKADIVLKQLGEPLKRCLIDIDPNTGRVRFRVAETSNGGTFSAPG
ncbi:MAG TPA: type II secretion system protein [Planctomycetota bacterium]|nr:type II secretion system protein [Planctomycetota bacterium]